jgi:hypothetical protein
MSRVCVLVQPSTGMCLRELGTRPGRGKKGAQCKESNKHMLYLRDIKQSKELSCLSLDEIARPEKEKVRVVEGGCSRAIGQLTIHRSFFFLDALSMVL